MESLFLMLLMYATLKSEFSQKCLLKNVIYY